MTSESESQALCALPFSMTKDSCCQVHADVIMLTSCSHLATTEQDVLKKCREAFEQFDMDGSGTIEPWELKVTPRLANLAQRMSRYIWTRPVGLIEPATPVQETLQAMGQTPTDEDMEEMFLELDHDNSGGIDFLEVPSHETHGAMHVERALMWIRAIKSERTNARTTGSLCN